uniref:Uncharacterized protein n=1 Tax=Caenorhabditis tropicalis TaxID=1561998 RepID=A0A1I7V2S1_9PELO
MKLIHRPKNAHFLPRPLTLSLEPSFVLTTNHHVIITPIQFQKETTSRVRRSGASSLLNTGSAKNGKNTLIKFQRLLNLFQDTAPSLNEIKNLKNSDLDEIFGSTMSKTPPPDLPDMTPMGGVSGPVGRFDRVPGGPREIPINHGHALSPQPHANQGEFQSLAAQGANVFATGATAFYRGAATVGEAFGIPTGNYQVPLFNQAAGLFGR